MECEQCHRELEPESFRLGHYNILILLDQTAPTTDDHGSAWALTTYLDDHKGPTALRLRFSLDDNNGDVDCVFFMRFEVRPPGATAFEALASAEVIPYWFTREGHEPGWGVGDRCVCKFPTTYRDEFIEMVTQLGELRCLAQFG